MTSDASLHSQPSENEASRPDAASILIVDDTPVNLSVVVEYLQEYGYSIRIARSGESALQRIEYGRPDLILLDVLLPGIDGFEVCQRIKQNEETSDIPVIFMTSLTRSQDKVRGFEAGAVDYVTKPLQREEVLARVTTHLRLRQLTHDLRERNRQIEERSRIERTRLIEAVNQQHTQLQALNSKLTEVQERERKELARELHDELGQALTAITINMAAVRSTVEEQNLPNPTALTLRNRLDEALELAEQTLEQVRQISLDLRPPMLDDLGLVPTLRWIVKRFEGRTNVQIRLSVEGMEEYRPPPHIETTLYRIIQEALTNVARHAGASCVELNLRQTDQTIIASVQDDGQGFDVAQVSQTPQMEGLGLLGIQERVSLVGGTLEIESSPGNGCCLIICVPIGEDHG